MSHFLIGLAIRGPRERLTNSWFVSDVISDCTIRYYCRFTAQVRQPNRDLWGKGKSFVRDEMYGRGLNYYDGKTNQLVENNTILHAQMPSIEILIMAHV